MKWTETKPVQPGTLLFVDRTPTRSDHFLEVAATSPQGPCTISCFATEKGRKLSPLAPSHGQFAAYLPTQRTAKAWAERMRWETASPVAQGCEIAVRTCRSIQRGGTKSGNKLYLPAPPRALGKMRKRLDNAVASDNKIANLRAAFATEIDRGNLIPIGRHMLENRISWGNCFDTATQVAELDRRMGVQDIHIASTQDNSTHALTFVNTPNFRTLGDAARMGPAAQGLVQDVWLGGLCEPAGSFLPKADAVLTKWTREGKFVPEVPFQSAAECIPRLSKSGWSTLHPNEQFSLYLEHSPLLIVGYDTPRYYSTKSLPRAS